MKVVSLLFITLAMLAEIPLAQAEDNTAQLTVTVTILLPPCDINNNQTIDVDFGNNVITTEVAQGVYEKPVNYTLDCSGMDTSRTLKMRIAGTGASFDNNVLKTSIASLGVKIKKNGADYPINSDISFASQSDKPVFTAQLVQETGSRLPTGAFSAGATMTVDYQ
ncbi:fimbrial protein [Siccibacter turicensis]|uniref:fimbrial protein n=1 Tax=Siccibacter turicensis TaxID=357233 RepID=UPI0010225C44|nr:fimbrial protein [Siccibacter turicensis]